MKDTTKLPKWAREHIAFLERRLKETEKARDESPLIGNELDYDQQKKAGAVSVPVFRTGVGVGWTYLRLNETRIQFGMGGSSIEVSLETDGKGIATLAVQGTQRIRISPSAANCIRIQVEED